MPGKKPSAGKARPKNPSPSQNGGPESQKEAHVAASRKRTADQLGEGSGTKESAAVNGTRRVQKRAPLDWRVQRIVRDLGRLDVLRRGDVGPDVVSEDEDEDETALDILVRKLVEDADEGGHMPPAPEEDVEYDDIWDDGDNDHPGGALDVDNHMEDDFMPAAPDHIRGEGADSIAVVTQNGDESLADGVGNRDNDEIVDEASGPAQGNGDDDVFDLVSDGEDESPSIDGTASTGIQVAAASANSAGLLPTDVNYNHGARNRLSDPTAQPVFQPGDDDVLGRLKGLARRQIEWFAASSKDVAHRKGTKYPIVLGQVGFRCVHCAHIPFTARERSAVHYPKNYFAMDKTLSSYYLEHLTKCEQIPVNIKAHSSSLSGCQSIIRGRQRREYLMNGFQSIGIVEEDGRLVYDKSRTSMVDDKRDVIGSDGSEEGYWLCDKCQSVKFANFDEACRHEDSCHGVPDVTGLEQSDRLLHKPETSDSTKQGEGAYVLSLCCECNEVEDPSSDVPMLLCDGCDSATHLTCTKDIPKLTEVPGGEWYCSICALVNKRLSEDRAISTAFTAVGEVLDDNFCTIPNEGTKRGPIPNSVKDMFQGIPGIQSEDWAKRPGCRRRKRLCVVMGCTRHAGSIHNRYLCRSHASRARLLEQIQTMPNGERRFPCRRKHQSLPQDHERAYIAVPPNAKHGTRVKCSNAVCRSLGSKHLHGNRFQYCAVCDNVFEKSNFSTKHRHGNGLEIHKKRTSVDTACQVADEINAADGEIVYGFDSIRGHTKDRKRKGEYLFRVTWKNGEITSEPDTYLKEDDPATFVAYLKNSGLAKTKKYAWANEEEHAQM